MSLLLKSATIVEPARSSVERADLRIAGGRIAERAAAIEPNHDDEVIDLDGRLIMPGMVCAHTHLYSTLARGMPAPPRSPLNFKEILELIWWRLDRALDDDTIYWSALAGAIEAARAGTTCLFDHHSSPSRIRGSLEIVREAIESVGLRGVLCYEITDRGTPKQRDDGVEENDAFIRSAGRNPGGLFRGLVGAHASFTLSNETLEKCAGLMAESGAGLHIHVAEDLCDVRETRQRFNAGIVERLAKSGALNDRAILAHGTHLDQAEIEIARDARVWFAHNPRSNMNNTVGYAPVRSFGDRIVLGTDGIGADIFDETRFAFFKARENSSKLSADSWLEAVANNQRLASETFGIELGSCLPNAAADLIVLDYGAPTPITSDNLAWHMLFGMSSRSIESVMVNGKFVIRNGRLSFDDRNAYEEMRRASRKLWSAMESL